MDEHKPKKYRLLRYPTQGKDDKTYWKTCGRAIDLGEKIMIVLDAVPMTTNKLFFFKNEQPSKEETQEFKPVEEETQDIKVTEEKIGDDLDFIDADQLPPDQKKLGEANGKETEH